MLIGDLEEGSKIAVSITGYPDKIFSTHVVKLSHQEQSAVEKLCKKLRYTSCIPVGLIYDGEQSVIFPSKYTYHIAAHHKGRMFLWNPVVIHRAKSPTLGSIHLLFSSADTDAYNRRMEFRLPMDKVATANVGDDRSLYHIFLKDISEHGFGLIVDQNAKVSIGDTVTISFMEEAYNNTKRIWESTRYEMTGQIVRLFVTSGNKYNIGCYVRRTDRQVSSYIYAKQVQQARLTGSDRHQAL